MSARSVHPSSDEIDAALCGRLNAEAMERVRSHAAGCRKCGGRLSREEHTRSRLELLATGVPEVNVVQQVLDRIAAREQNQVLDNAEPDCSRSATENDP